jgi:6-pyruvoyltetrahydropterin/6-carboxytetrahydropterin synthase
MVCDLDLLDAALQRIDDTVRDQNLEIIRPADADAVTVEVFARWAHERLDVELQGTGAEMLTVRVWESPVAFGGYSQQIR